MSGEKLGKLKAKAAAVRYRHADRTLRIILVAGEYGTTTTARYLAEVLQEAGQSVLALTNRGCYFDGSLQDVTYDTSAQAMHRCLSLARRNNVATVIVEMTDALVQTNVLETLLVEMSVLTSEGHLSDEALKQPVKSIVVPSGYDVSGLSVAPHQVISFGEDETADARIKYVHLFRKGTEVTVVIDHQTNVKLSTYLIGKANAYSIAAAVAAAYVLPLDTGVFEEGIARLESVAGNYTYIDAKQVYKVAVDGAHHKRSVELVIESAAKLKKRRLILVFDETVDVACIDAAKKASDRLIVVGKAGDGVTGVDFEPTASEAAALALRGAKLDDTVVLIGRNFAKTDEASGRLTAELLINTAGS